MLELMILRGLEKRNEHIKLNKFDLQNVIISCRCGVNITIVFLPISVILLVKNL
jgi:hypothetical protein